MSLISVDWKSDVLFPTGPEICFVLHRGVHFGFWDSLTLRTGGNYKRVRQKERVCDPFPGSSAEVCNALIVTPCFAYTFMSWCFSTVSSCFASAPHCMATDISMRRPCAVMRNVLSFYGEELLASHSAPKLEDHPLFIVCDCLFSIFAPTLHIGNRSYIRNLRTHNAVMAESVAD
jgi:hypothetical protein